MLICLIDMHHGEFPWRPDTNVVPVRHKTCTRVHDQFGCIIFLA